MVVPPEYCVAVGIIRRSREEVFLILNNFNKMINHDKIKEETINCFDVEKLEEKNYD